MVRSTPAYWAYLAALWLAVAFLSAIIFGWPL